MSNVSSYAVVASGIVANIVLWDGMKVDNGWAPPEGSTAILLGADDLPHIGLGYANGVYEQPPAPVVTPPTAAEILAANTANQDALASAASVAIAPLQLAVSLGEATSAETALAQAWVAYFRALKAVDLTQASPVWPTPPV